MKPAIMGIDDARREARRRWGFSGTAITRDGECIVGTIGGDMLPNGTFAYGRGWSWEEAFADADRRSEARS